jgi:hypothetical protein
VPFIRYTTLGVNKNTLHTWISKYRGPKQQMADSAADEHLYDELKLLRKENKRLTEERDILKKAASIPGCGKPACWRFQAPRIWLKEARAGVKGRCAKRRQNLKNTQRKKQRFRALPGRRLNTKKCEVIFARTLRNSILFN